MYENELNDLLDYLDALNEIERQLIDAINDGKDDDHAA